MNQKKAGIILSYTSEVIKILTSLLFTPIMLRLLGQSEYGLYQLVYSVVSYLGILSLGFTASYIRYYSGLKKEEDTEGIHRLNGMFLTIFLVIAAIALLCGTIMTGNIRAILGERLTEAEYTTARVLMILMVINLSLTFPNSVFNCITSAHEQFFFQRLLTVLQNLLNPFLSFPLLLMGYGSVGLVLVTTLLTVSKLLVNIWFVFRRLHERFLFGQFNFRLLRDIWGFTFFIFLNQIIDQINWSVDRFLLGRIIGTGAVAVYGLGGQINTMYVQLSSSISSVFVPKVNRIVSESNDNTQLTALLTRVGRVQFLLLGLVVSGFVFFGSPFMRFWGGAGYEDSYPVALWLIIPVTVPLIQNIGIEIQRAKNMHKTRSIVYFCVAIANIFISIPLIRAYGPVGAAVGTAISLLAGNVIFMNWYYQNRIGLDMFFFWRSIGTVCKGLLLPVALGALMMRFVRIDSIPALIACALVYAAVYGASMWMLGMNTYEKDQIRKTLRRGNDLHR